MQRRKNVGLPKVASQDDLATLPEKFVKVNEERFLIFNGVNSELRRILIFGSTSGVDLITKEDLWAVDGIFNTATNLFYQVYPGNLII